MEDIRKGTCPLCRHNEIVEAGPTDLYGELPWQKPMVVTRGVGKHGKPIDQDGHGRLALFVCRQCGFSQWFTADPQTIPIKGEYLTRIIKGPEPEGPYR
jgi:hypothetical protein